MSEMKIGSFWKCLQQVLGDARLPDTQQVNPWRIVRIEGADDLPSRLPRPDDEAAPKSESPQPAPPASVAGRPAPLFVRF